MFTEASSEAHSLLRPALYICWRPGRHIYICPHIHSQKKGNIYIYISIYIYQTKKTKTHWRGLKLGLALLRRGFQLWRSPLNATSVSFLLRASPESKSTKTNVAGLHSTQSEPVHLVSNDWGPRRMKTGSWSPAVAHDSHDTANDFPEGSNVCLAHLSAACYSPRKRSNQHESLCPSKQLSQSRRCPLLGWLLSHMLHTWEQTFCGSHSHSISCCPCQL